MPTMAPVLMLHELLSFSLGGQDALQLQERVASCSGKDTLMADTMGRQRPAVVLRLYVLLDAHMHRPEFAAAEQLRHVRKAEQLVPAVRCAPLLGQYSFKGDLR